MEFWRWLTSRDGLPVLIAIIGVLGTIIGVTATIITQILTTRATAARETARLQFEKDRWQNEQEAAARSRFEDFKREAFIGYLQAAYRIQHLVGVFSRYRWEFFVARKERRSLFEADGMLSNFTTELRLLAPEVYYETNAVAVQVNEMLSLMLAPGYRQHRLEDEELRLLELIQSARHAMQRSLGVEVQADEGDIAKGLETYAAWRKSVFTEILESGRLGPKTKSPHTRDST